MRRTALSLGARGESRGQREQVRLGGLTRRGERAEEGVGGALDLMERSMRVVIGMISNSRWVYVLNPNTRIGSEVTRRSQTIGVLLHAGDPCCMVR
jgi:hypothetical protein